MRVCDAVSCGRFSRFCLQPQRSKRAGALSAAVADFTAVERGPVWAQPERVVAEHGATWAAEVQRGPT